jgi:hypothetical protein
MSGCPSCRKSAAHRNSAAETNSRPDTPQGHTRNPTLRRAASDLLNQRHMQSTFTHKLLMNILAGFGAACIFWVFRHVVQEAFYESGDGWKDSLHGATAEHRHQ